MRYGGRGIERNTIHATEQVDVETDENGKVVSVWFRCMMLPFQQATVDDYRAKEMISAYEQGHVPTLIAVEVEDV